MDLRDLFLEQHARSHTAAVGTPDFSNQDLVTDGMTDEQLRSRPQPGINSMAWLLWHMTRVEDVGINLVIAGRPQVLDAGGWMARLGVERRDIGAGMTDREVDAFNARIDVAKLFRYRLAVGQQSQGIVRDLPLAVLDEVIDAELVQGLLDAGAFGPNAEWVPLRWEGKRKGYTLMHSVLAHSYFHIGQGDDIRGLHGLSPL